MHMLRAIDGFARSTDRAALLMDRSTAQRSINHAARLEDDHTFVAHTDRAARSVDGAAQLTDRAAPSTDRAAPVGWLV